MKKIIFILLAGLMNICGYSQTIVCDSTENIKLKQQVEDAMKSNEIVTQERDLLYTSYSAYSKTTNIKLKKKDNLVKGILIGGSVYIAVTLPILIYLFLK